MKIKIGLIIALFFKIYIGTVTSLLWGMESEGLTLADIRKLRKEVLEERKKCENNYFCGQVEDRSEEEIDKFIKKYPLLCFTLELDMQPQIGGNAQLTYNCRHDVSKAIIDGYSLDAKKKIVARAEAFMQREESGWPAFAEEYADSVKKNKDKKLHDKIPQKEAIVWSVVKARKIHANLRKAVLDFRADFFSRWMEYFPKSDKELEEQLKVDLCKEALDWLTSFDGSIKRVEANNISIIIDSDEEKFQSARERDCCNYKNLLTEMRSATVNELKNFEARKDMRAKDKNEVLAQGRKGLGDIEKELLLVSQSGQCKKFASNKLEDKQVGIIPKNIPRSVRNLINPRNGKSRFETEFQKIEKAQQAYAAKQEAVADPIAPAGLKKEETT